MKPLVRYDIPLPVGRQVATSTLGRVRSQLQELDKRGASIVINGVRFQTIYFAARQIGMKIVTQKSDGGRIVWRKA